MFYTICGILSAMMALSTEADISGYVANGLDSENIPSITLLLAKCAVAENQKRHTNRSKFWEAKCRHNNRASTIPHQSFP